MKKTLLIAVFLGISLVAFTQTPSQNDEVTNLKKQISSLKQTNAKLEMNLKELRQISKSLQDSINKNLKEYDLKLNCVADSLKANTRLLHATKSHANLLDHSLKTRKAVFYIVFVLAIILLIALYLLSNKKIKSMWEKNDVKLFNLKDAIEVDASKTKSDFQAQISLVKAELTSAREELERKIKEAKK